MLNEKKNLFEPIIGIHEARYKGPADPDKLGQNDKHFLFGQIGSRALHYWSDYNISQ